MNTTAGKGDPYWYEWTVGLVKVVEMLQPESQIQSVAFQVEGFKGWDDVVVVYSDGSRDFIQVKNSRVDANITFGTLVSVDKDGVSLLSSLFDAWKEMQLRPQLDRCIVYTNRAAGGNAGKSDAGVHRPPLLKFFQWLTEASKGVKSLTELSPPKEWAGAWGEWLTQLKGNDAEKLDFLKALQILPNQEDLKELEESVLAALVTTFQIDRSKALPLLHALDNALRRWSTTDQTVDAEGAYSAMALGPHVDIEHRAPPPPQPFFPSHNKLVSDLENELQATPGFPVIFLSAAPGAGKTSIVSEIANRRVSQAFQGIVGLRYFAFKPITPESPLIPPDADQYVRPDRLWFILLSQLRVGLHGKLRAYQVPLRNDLLTWSEARTHVLRIAARLGGELGRPFVIVVDGIDHAARAMRFDPQAKEFFSSLPGPDELADKPIRFLLAGQPAESYPEYPTWVSTNPKVKTVTIGKMRADDILLLLQSKNTPIPLEQHAAVVQVIEEETQGNTLAVVFAVHEAITCASSSELKTRLGERNLGDGLQTYYDSIWRHALKQIESAPPGMEIALASALCLTPERLNGPLMASAFVHLKLSAEQWELLLATLGPMLVSESDGFRILHNDVRVYLHGFLGRQPLAARRKAASWIADHYIDPSSNRWFAHKALRRLLKDAGREQDWARVFTVDWVFEAAALGINSSDLSDECVEALKQGVSLRQWDVMHELACGTETLDRWREICEHGDVRPSAYQVELVPAFFSTEIFVPPQSNWTRAELQNLINDAQSLLRYGESARATGLLNRWLQNLSIIDLCQSVAGLVVSEAGSGEDKLQLNDNGLFEVLGKLCRSVGVVLPPGVASSKIHRHAQARYEAGWVLASCQKGPFTNPSEFQANRPLTYWNSYEVALPKLAELGQWDLVRSLMREVAPERDKFRHSFQAQAAWWAVRSGASNDNLGWLDILSQRHFGFTDRNRDDLASALSIAMALAWREPSAEPGNLAQRVFASLQIEPDRVADYTHYRLLLRAAATLGRARAVLRRRGKAAASEMLPPGEMVQLVNALWLYDTRSHKALDHRRYGGQLASQFASLVFELNDEHLQALLTAAHPIADKAPMDFRSDSLWQLYRRSGEMSRLRQWVRTWLDDNGLLWSGDADGRQAVADDLIPLARELGENELVAKTEERLRWLQITYRSHEEVSLGIPVAWFDELAKMEPRCWRDRGIRLWSLSEACSALGGDDSYSFQLGTALGAAAWGSGPSDLLQLLTAEYSACGRNTWYYPAANRLIDGFLEHMNRCPQLPISDKLAGWCLAVGFSRWFRDNDIKTLAELRVALINSTTELSERSSIADAISKLTPGESLRNPPPESDVTASTSEPDVADVDTWSKRVAAGKEIPPTTVARLIGSMLSEQRPTFDADATKFLSAVGTGGAWPWTWGPDAALFTIARAVSDELLWSLVSAAIKYAGGNPSAWTQGVTRNLQNVLLARASSRGAEDVRAGLDRILAMHDRWSGNGKGNLPLPSIKVPSATQINDYNEAALHCLTFVLASRSAEVIQSALVGIHALISHQPRLIPLLLELVDADPWKQQWISNAAEVWARHHPGEVAKARGMLEKWGANGSLHLRIQAWIVLRILAQVEGIALPAFPNPAVRENYTDRLGAPRRNILATPASVHGSFQMLDIYRSAESAINRAEAALQQDLADIKHAVSSELQNETEADRKQQPWPSQIVCSGDTRCSNLQKEFILDKAFDDFFSRSPITADQECRFAQAYLTSEEPWILRSTPMPDLDDSAWPAEDELRDLEEGSDPAGIRRKFLHLATQHGIKSSEIVIAARIQLFTWQSDFLLYTWWQDGAENRSDLPPGIISGRTFAFAFDTWFEPNCTNPYPLAYPVGGYTRLMMSFPEFFPSQRWRTHFGWAPSSQDPLLWMSGETPVARYERIHGRPRFTQSGHPRQPILSRWVVTKAAWEKASASHGPFHHREEFVQFPSSVEQ